MSFFSKIRELKEIFKTSGIVGVRNNIQYEVNKLDEDIEARKQIIKKAKNDIERLKSTRK